MRRNPYPKAQLRRKLPHPFTRPLRPILDSDDSHFLSLRILISRVFHRRIPVRETSGVQLPATVGRRILDLRVRAGPPRVAVDCSEVHGGQRLEFG